MNLFYSCSGDLIENFEFNFTEFLQNYDPNKINNMNNKIDNIKNKINLIESKLPFTIKNGTNIYSNFSSNWKKLKEFFYIKVIFNKNINITPMLFTQLIDKNNNVIKLDYSINELNELGFTFIIKNIKNINIKLLTLFYTIIY